MNEIKVWGKKGRAGPELGAGIGMGAVKVSEIDLVEAV